jgi:hypothetical protein
MFTSLLRLPIPQQFRQPRDLRCDPPRPQSAATTGILLVMAAE